MVGRGMKSLILFGALALAACGNEIGDECIVSSDCSPNGDRTCIDPATGGYCTILGCDIGTCPEEGVCVRFFTGSFANRSCNPETENGLTDECGFDEICTVGGECAPRSSEIRYCMLRCEEVGDCREGYECRDLDLMIDHGGEPVLADGAIVDATSPKFCAVAPAS